MINCDSFFIVLLARKANLIYFVRNFVVLEDPDTDPGTQKIRSGSDTCLHTGHWVTCGILLHISQIGCPSTHCQILQFRNMA